MSSPEHDEIARQLYRACETGNCESLSQLLSQHSFAGDLIDLTYRNDAPKAITEKTIYTACLKGHVDVVKELLINKINPNAICDLGTPMYAAIKTGNMAIIKLLLQFGADVRRVRGGYNPLFVACVEGKLSVLSYLVEKGADLFFLTNPPLVFTACQQGHLDILQYLMDEMEYDIHRTIHGEDAMRTDGKDSLLYVACHSNKLEIADYLLHHGAIITHTITTKFPLMVKELLERRIKPSSRPTKPGSPPSLTARWREMGLSEVSWKFLENYSSKLTKLELKGNRLSSIPEQIFQMSSLRVLDVSQNLLTEICHEEVIWNCQSLSELDISKNQVAYIPSGLLSLQQLTNMNLSYNHLQRLPGDAEDACPNAEWKCELLKKLDVSHNRLRGLPDKFNNLRRLNILNVSYNHLYELPSSCSLGCIGLVQLDAAHNSISELPHGAACFWMYSLEKLYLSHNDIHEISPNITELAHLTTLDLSHNHIKHLPPTKAWTNTRMCKLSIAYNNLTTLTHQLEEEQKYTRSGDTPQRGGDSSRRGTTPFTEMFRPRPKAKKKTQEPVAPTLPDNSPRELPVEKWATTLQSLYLQNNSIKFLPNYIGNFVALARLDISNNTSIHCLPLQFGCLKNCWELIMHGLEITNVPKQYLPGVGRGASTKQLITYLKAQLKNSKPYNRMKLMAVGLQGRGKTTLLSVLRDSSASLPPNVSTVGVDVHEWILKGSRARGATPRQQMDVVFSTWDLAGQQVYYATHQCFLSRNTLYLLVWNMAEEEKGINYLRPWLLNVQARAPYSPVIIVGTHLDKLSSNRVAEMKRHFHSLIYQQYDRDGYPSISDVCMVSCVTKEGIRELQERIHIAAINAKDPDTHEYVIGMQVPSGYIELQRLVDEEVRKCSNEGRPPVLNQKEFAAIAERTGDISDPEELSLGAQFLHDNGVILHYNDHLRGLNNLYFIDPVWLADMLAHIITVPQKQSFVQNGQLNEIHLKFIFRGNRNFPEAFLPQYMQLLERFEIALSLGHGMLLIPSMLPEQRPALPFARSLPRVKAGSQRSEPPVKKKDIKGPVDTFTNDDDPFELTKIVNGKEVVCVPAKCVRRRYKMAYIPSGFWSRLISRLMINLKRSDLMSQGGAGLSDPQMIFWRRGLLALHPSGKFLVESIQAPVGPSAELSGVAIGTVMMEASARLVGEGIERTTCEIQGVDITVWSDNGDFSAMGYVVDQLDSLIDEWFPGLNDLDLQGEWLVERQALWVVPPEIKEAIQGGSPDVTYDHSAIVDPSVQDVFVFRLEDCALKALVQDYILCSEYNVYVPFTHLVPDLLMTDLPSSLRVDKAAFEFNPKDTATRLGRGGAGAVYKGRYHSEPVAVKEFLTQSQAESYDDEYGDNVRPAYDPEDDSITSGEALFLFRDMRQEVTVLAQLSHNNIVALLGVSLRPMCIILELAPMGSLFGILDKRLEAIKTAQADLPTATIKSPGGILGHEISARIALQVALALQYLHAKGIVYRDLKSDNVLIWSLDIDELVNAKLADYGISRFANPGGIKGEEGTPGYMAPEAIRRRGEDQAFDEKVDVFSFGMLLFELLTGQRPFESLTSGQEVNRAILQRERPQIEDGNIDHQYPSMVDLMYICWEHLAVDRPSAAEVVSKISNPGFLCRRHTITSIKEHPLQKINTLHAQPHSHGGDVSYKKYALWTWSREDSDRNYSILSTDSGRFTFSEVNSPGGRVCAMVSTGEVDKRVWIASTFSKSFKDFEIQVYGYQPMGEPLCLWSFVMADTCLDMKTVTEGDRVKHVFASMANGTLVIFSRKSIATPLGPGDAKVVPSDCKIKCDIPSYTKEAEDWADPLILTLSPEGYHVCPIKCMTFVGQDRLWCGCGNNISVVDTINIKVINSIPVLVKRNQFVTELVSNGQYVWGIGRQLSCVIEWEAASCKLMRIFDCSRVDPTGESIVANPSTVPELVTTEQQLEDSHSPSSSPAVKDDISDDSSSPLARSTSPVPGFIVKNDPSHPSRSSGPTYQRFGTRISEKAKRGRRHNMKDLPTAKQQPNFEEAKKLAGLHKMLRTQGATRTTSLLMVNDILWVARGMGDILIINVNDTTDHGQVMARLTSEEEMKYGNRSTHKIVLVAGEYVASSQWLEPLEMPSHSRPTEGTGDRRPTFAGGDHHPPAHQQITIWRAWDHSHINNYNQKVNNMIKFSGTE